MSQFIAQNKLKHAWYQFLLQEPPQRFVTFNFNQKELSVQAAHSMLGAFGVRINRRLHGRNYNKLINKNRTYFVAVPEHLNSNLHFHAGLWTPDVSSFDEHASAIWKQVIASGQINFECKVFTETDQKKIAAYITKCTVKESSFESIFIFSNKHERAPP